MSKMKLPILFLFLSLPGCGGESSSGPVDVSKLRVPTAEEQQAIQARDQAINDEEFGKPMPGSKPNVPRKK